jgi:hypothetical protein
VRPPMTGCLNDVAIGFQVPISQDSRVASFASRRPLVARQTIHW